MSDVYFCLATHSQLLTQQPSTRAFLPPPVGLIDWRESGHWASVNREGVCGGGEGGRTAPFFAQAPGVTRLYRDPPPGLTYRGDPRTTKLFTR